METVADHRAIDAIERSRDRPCAGQRHEVAFGAMPARFRVYTIEDSRGTDVAARNVASVARGRSR
jgi:hypothetical protein